MWITILGPSEEITACPPCRAIFSWRLRFLFQRKYRWERQPLHLMDPLHLDLDEFRIIAWDTNDQGKGRSKTWGVWEWAPEQEMDTDLYRSPQGICGCCKTFCQANSSQSKVSPGWYLSMGTFFRIFIPRDRNLPLWDRELVDLVIFNCASRV